VYKLAATIPSINLPGSERFLDLTELDPNDRLSLLRIAHRFRLPTSEETFRVLGSMVTTGSPAEVAELDDLGNRVIPSKAQRSALSAWPAVFRRIDEAPSGLRRSTVESAVRNYLARDREIARDALEADEEEHVDDRPHLVASYLDLANIVRWHRLRRLLRTIQVEEGKDWVAFLSWARKTVPMEARALLGSTDLEELL
jgi:hypothetical protein